MAVDTWGSMTEGAGSSRTILEAIQDAVNGHNQSTGAHSDSGEVLNEHETSDPVAHDGVLQLKVLASDPADTTEGRMYYNSSTGTVRVADGSTWSDV